MDVRATTLPTLRWIAAALIVSAAACQPDTGDISGPPTLSLSSLPSSMSHEPPEPWDDASDSTLAVNDFAPGTPSTNPRIQIPSGFVNYDCESMYYVIIGEMDKIVSYSRAFNRGVRSARPHWGLNFAGMASAVSSQRFDLISAGMDFGMASIIFSNFGCLDIYQNTLGPAYVAAARRAEAEYFQWQQGGGSGPAPWLAWFPASMNGL